ncbi:hypothetical protein F443_14799 [Phytophthora nicotianae P1569]|uniref:Uncharacterized protein n=1 Tax=Phytophthora nicotianae P1569 TaxID=1317065 RepID=V9EL05_PHYNI|nr:hypothetical protein F443_14799 [Phytophthora nicotianae P1569]
MLYLFDEDIPRNDDRVRLEEQRYRDVLFNHMFFKCSNMTEENALKEDSIPNRDLHILQANAAAMGGRMRTAWNNGMSPMMNNMQQGWNTRMNNMQSGWANGINNFKTGPANNFGDRYSKKMMTTMDLLISLN